MPNYDYKCNKCGFTDEYIIGKTMAEGKEPDVCPKCNEGKMERQFSPTKAEADVIGGYDYIYGKKNWKRNLSVADQAKVLSPDINGNYKDPY